MLNVDELKNQIKESIQNIIVPAIIDVIKTSYPMQTETGDERAKEMSETFDDLVSEQFAEALANAIDYYVKNISITGTLITTPMSPTPPSPPHFVKVISTIPMSNGVVPNTLGVK